MISTTALRTLAACGLVLSLALAAPASAQDRSIVVGAQNMAAFLDPARDFSNVGSQFYYNAFDSLVGKDVTKAESVWIPGLATEWRQLSPTAVELKLRPNVKFHNGETMTADDVVFSIDRVINPQFPPYAVMGRAFLSNFAGVEKIDEQTVRVTARKPEPLFETLLNIQQLNIVPKKYVASLSGDTMATEVGDYEVFSLKPMGTGPYRVAEFVPNQRVVYERHADFWGEKAPLAKATVTRIPELSARITALKNGEVDIITNVPPDSIKTIESDPKLRNVGSVTPLFHVVIFNQANPKMDKRIRQALAMAIDRKTLNEALWEGKANVPKSHTFVQFGQMYMPDLPTFEYNPEKAKQLLREAGYDGFPIRYDTQAAYYTNGLLAAQAIQEMWAAVGVKMQINVDDKWTGGDPTMMSRNWSNPMYFPDPAGSFGIMWAPGGNANSEGRWIPSEQFKEAWERFRYSTELAARKKAYSELMDIIKDDPPVVVLYQPYESFAEKKTVNWAPQPGHIPYVLDFRAGRISFAN